MRGPFGNYNHGSMGAVLNTLTEYYNVPVHMAENVAVGNEEIKYRGKLVARFKWFEGIDHACVMFCDPDWCIYGEHGWIAEEGEGLIRRPVFKVSLGVHGQAQFEIYGDMATEQLHEFIRYPMLTNFMDHDCYKLTKVCGAFFQGGSIDPKGKWIMVEFWKHEGVQAWMEYLNKHYVHDPAKWAEFNDMDIVMDERNCVTFVPKKDSE